MARRPSSANALAVKTRNGSSVTAKIAGMESTAKTTSVTSTRTRTASSGVASRTPPAPDEEPLAVEGVGHRHRSAGTTSACGTSSGSMCGRAADHPVPVHSRNAAKT